MALVTIQRSPSPSNSPESEEDAVDVGSTRQRSFSENYFTVKGAALILPQSDSSQRSSRNNGGDIQQHLQQMFYLLRPEDTIKVAVKLESFYQDRKIWRYMAVVCCNGNQDTEESIILGLDLRENEATIGLVLPVWANTQITLDGDGGFSVNSEGADYLFKPVSVQAMWSALQSLHKVINTANLHNYIPKGLTHTWVEFYKAKINSDVSCIKEWNLMEDIESYAADSPYSSEKQELDTDGMKNRISIKLRELMMAIDLEETTSKELRNSLEVALNTSLIEYKSYIDTEMMRILGQMDAPSEIFPYLYLGSEWNASNYEELEENGVNYILNVSREIDNFFPDKYHYMNVREFDNEQSDLMKHWKRTYEFIKKAKENNGKVLVHCKMGVSRSASTVIAFKMKEDGCSFQDAYKFVKEKRSVIRPNKAFMAQLVEYHGILTAGRKRFLFGSKSSSEEVDMEYGSGFNRLGNEARSLSGFTYYEPRDDPRFLPLDDATCYAFDHSDLFYNRDDLFEFLEPGQPRTRAYTLDNTLPSKFKADDSWITLPPSAIHTNLLAAMKQGDELDTCDTAVAPTTLVTSNTATDTAAAAVSLPHTKIQEVCSAVDIRCMEMSDGSSKAPTSPSKMAKVTNPPLVRASSLNGSKVTPSPLATTASADSSKVITYPFVLSDSSKVVTAPLAMTVSADGSKMTTSSPPAMTVSSNGSKVATSPFATTISSDGSKVATSHLATAVSSSDGSKLTVSPLAIAVSSNGSKVAKSPFTMNVSSDSSRVTVSSDGSKESNSPHAMTVSTDGLKEETGEVEDQAMAPRDCGPNNNNNDIDETPSDSVTVPVRYAKDNIPWNLGSVRKQREKMEEHIKTGSTTVTEAETVTEDDLTSWEILKKDEETPISDPHTPTHMQTSSTSFSTMRSSSPKLKTSHSFSTFPVGAEETQEGTPAGGGAVCETVPAGTASAERPQSVCLSSFGKDSLGTLGGSLKDSFQGSVQDPLFDPLNPVSLYEMEDIDLPAGIVRRTTKELEKKNRSSCHELTAVGLFHEETKKNPVQRSSSLGSESDRSRLERTKRRKTCTPILSPGNFGSSELLFYQQSGSLDCGDLFPDEGPNSEMLHPLYPAAAAGVEDHLLSPYTEKSHVKDIMVYRYGAEQVEITGGSVRRTRKNYESLAKESFDKETEDLAGLSESPNQTTLTTALGVQATSSKAMPPSSTPPTITTAASTANIPITTASKTTSTCVSPKNIASTPAGVDTINTTTAAQLTPKALRKQEFQGSVDKSQTDLDQDHDPCCSKATPVTLPSKEQVSTVNANVLSSSEEPSILSGCVTKMTKHIEQMSKDPPSNIVKDLSASKSHLFEGAAMSNARDSPLSCHLSERQSECHAVASGKDSGSKNVHPSDNSTTTHVDTERVRILKAKSMDESMLAVPPEGVDLPLGDGKTVRHLVGKFDPNLVKESETGTATTQRGDSPTPAISSGDSGGLQTKMSEVVGQSMLGTPFHTSPKKIVPSEQKSVLPCSASQVLPNTFGAMDCPSSSAESSSSVGVSKPLTSTTLTATSHKLTHLSTATPFSTTSSITTTTTTAVASVAVTTASIATATSSSTATPGGNFATASTKCVTQTGSVNTQASNVQSIQWWSQNTQCKTGGSTGPAPCPHSVSTTTSTSVTSASASSSPPTSHHVPTSTAATASSSSTSSLTCRPPFMLESRAFLQEGRKVRKLQGKTHPLSKLEGRQYSERRSANPSFYGTM